MKKKRLLFLRAIPLLALVLALALDGALLFTRDRSFSPLENRNLRALPAFSAAGFTSGRYEADFDGWLADQFPLRDGWVRLKSALDRFSGRRESGGVLLGQGGHLIQRFTPPDPQTYDDTRRALRDFLARHADLTAWVMIAPTAATVLRDRLPAFSDAGDESGYLDRLKADLSDTQAAFIDLRPAFLSAEDPAALYYRTDHHWTSQGAHLAYLELCRTAGLSDDPAAFSPALLAADFQGTLSAASGFCMADREDLWAYLPEAGAPDWVVTWVEENRRSASLYREACLDERDKYAVFLGGNFAQVRVETTAPGGTLLLLKDSYANCMVPLLTQHFSKILVVDPRYFTGDLQTLMAAENVDTLLILYNALTLARDTALAADLR